MRTLGIDLATSGGKTGICEIDWQRRRSTVEVGQFPDAVIAERIRAVRDDGGWTAIDAPFGFPIAFVRSVHDWRASGQVMQEREHNIRWRLTDEFVAARQSAIKAEHLPGPWNPWPLSSVVSLITPSVIRCARILTAVHKGEPVDRVGFGSRIVEAYPIAALRAWGILTNQYKKVAADCAIIFEALCESASVSRPEVVGCVPVGCDDDALDAFVCGLIARVVAVSDGATGPTAVSEPHAPDIDTVRLEGWIHLPLAGHPLDALAMDC